MYSVESNILVGCQTAIGGQVESSHRHSHIWIAGH